MHFKNTDVRWGAGEGTLPSLSVDENFYETKTRLESLEASPPEAVSVDHVTHDATANTITIVLTDGYSFGPFTLPSAKFQMVGEWQPLTAYPANVFVTEGGTSYLINYAHTSAATFDPGANDGLGHDYYSALPFPNAPVISWLDDGWTPDTTIPAYSLFSIADVGVFLTLHAFDSGATFDPDLQDGLGRDVYLKVFAAIETNKQRLQFQYPGTPPTDASVILVYIQDDTRDLLFAENWTDSSAHLDTACTDTIEWSIWYNGVNVGMITFEPGTLLDGEGGQFATFAGDGAVIGNQELLRIRAPGYADATARFLTVSLVGTYQDPS